MQFQTLDNPEIIDIVEKFVENIVMKCQVKHYNEIDKIRGLVSNLYTSRGTIILGIWCTSTATRESTAVI